MNNLQIFRNSEFGEMRTIELNGEPWFVASDICTSLEYQNGSRDVQRHVDVEDIQVTSLMRGGQMRNSLVINESGLYSMILSSKMPNAKKFKHWVTSEVIPSIRKTGVYLSPLVDSKMMFQIAQALENKEKEVVSLTAKIESDKPKVLFANSVCGSTTSILIRDLAKLLKQNGVDIGEKRLFESLRNHGFLITKLGKDYNSPTQKSMDMQLMEVKETSINHAGGSITVQKTPLITGKGQQYFINKFLIQKGA